MEATIRPRVKICCIADIEEAWMAIRYGASAIGLVSAMPSGPGVIDEALIGEIAAHSPPGIATFLLTSQQDAASIVEQQRRLKVNTVQICDRLERGSYEWMREQMPGIALVQVIHVADEESLQEALQTAPFVNAVLLDSGNQTLSVKELGGTGRTHNWEISRRIREQLSVPVYLAGGLHAGNVREAVEQVGPFGLDVCSRLRTDGRLDERKLSAFFKALGK